MVNWARGLVGIGVFIMGVFMLFFEQTKTAAYLPLGFGLGMTAGGLSA